MKAMGEKTKKRILLTNDDGIQSDGIRRLAEAATAFGEVWVVAPESQRSAASHSITLNAPVDVYPASFRQFPVDGVRAFYCSGTPADCVRVGIHAILPGKPDLLLSGINDGYNAASDLQYSATVGAAFEAVFQGVPALAFSEAAKEAHSTTDAFLDIVLQELVEGVFVQDLEMMEPCIMNVNFPGCSASECKGILRDRRVDRGCFYRDKYPEKQKLPGGGVRLEVQGHYNEDAEPGTDFAALVDGYVSIGKVWNIGNGR